MQEITLAEFLICLNAPHDVGFRVEVTLEDENEPDGIKTLKYYDDTVQFIDEELLDMNVKDFEFFNDFVDIYLG